MKLYLSGFYAKKWVFSKDFHADLTEGEAATIRKYLHHVLESYYYLGRTNVDYIRERNDTVFIDSGAYSAWTKQESLSLREYGTWLSDHADIIRKDDGFLMAANLDVIGDPERTLAHQKGLESMGHQVLPIFHLGEPVTYLQLYLDGYQYIGLGGMVGTPPHLLKKALDHLWGEYLTNEDGSAKVRVHGFGMTSKPLMERYPWYSVDSSVNARVGVNGGIYDKRFGRITCNERSTKEFYPRLEHLDEHNRCRVLDRIRELGFTEQRLRENSKLRVCYNACEMASEGITGQPFTESVLSLF